MVMAAGDIACDPASGSFNGGAGTATSCRQKATSDLLVAANPSAVLILGDDQYECGGLSAYEQSFDPSWGRLKGKLHPAIGNHQYLSSGGTDCDPTGHAQGYYSYYGAAAGDPSKGYYAFDVDAYWRAYAINSNCSQAGGCGVGSPQYTWLESDLKAHAGKNVIAYWHHPRYSSGEHGDHTMMDPIWDLLVKYGAEIVLAGHDHDYERFAPMGASDNRDDSQGVREFVVGTGGKNHYGFVTTRANSQVRNGDTYGVLRLTLYPDHYDWAFLPEAGKTFTDSGSSPTH
ncbi:MAG: metallophosphoesterase [Thermomicrobiaceae bacterium]|nr:metallophosphoesterase [Thermomicrobiaceae bacterium]